MSTASHHSEWLSLVEVSGPFLSMPVLLRVFPQGLDAHDPEKFRTLKLAYDEWKTNTEAGARTNPAIHAAWIKFVLTNVLGLPDNAILEQQAIPQSLQASIPEHGELLRPSVVIADPSTGKPRLLIQSYQPNQDLDKPVSGKNWKASSGTRMMELLHATGVRLGLVTNGEHWMLVDAPKNETTGFASWYSNVWLDEKITLQAFTSLLGTERFFNAAEADTLEQMLLESASNQQEVTDQLGYQVRRAVEVLIQSLDRADQDHDHQLLEGVDEKLLYEAALTVMMRLVFLFCAEERRLLPIDSQLYAEHYAASTMREQLRKTADDHGEEILERRHDAWSRLLACFRLVFGGCEHPNLRMPPYGGHLFDPDRFPFLEGRKRGTTWRNCEADPLPINNRTVLHLLEALQLLQVKMPGGEKAARRLSFLALDIEQIGHVYEGLLDHTAKRATEPMLGLIGTRDREPEVPLSKLEELKIMGDEKLIKFLEDESGKSASALKKAIKEGIVLTSANRLQSVIGGDGNLLKRIQPFGGLVREDTFGYPVVIPKGSVFVTAGTDRRSSGTHYTPKSLTEPLVRYTLEPLVYIGPAEGKPKDQWQLRSPVELLDLKICDMCCGSGAFLVQACRYLSERVVESWEDVERKLAKGTPGITPDGEASTGAVGETLIPKDADERMVYAKRIVAQRCLYGVDINSLAAEMAKLSMWLLTLAKDKPFTFLDHSIRSGDSLLGVHDPRQVETFSLLRRGAENNVLLVFLHERVGKAVTLRKKLESMPADNVEDVESQERLLRDAEALIERLKYAADFLLGGELAPLSRFDSEDDDPEQSEDGNKPGWVRTKKANASLRQRARDEAAIDLALHFNHSEPLLLQTRALAWRSGHRTFHWVFEFPEVFTRDVAGFDAIVGNPPFYAGTKLEPLLGKEWRAFVVSHLANDVTGVRGGADLSAYFFLRAGQLLRPNGQLGLLATKTIAEGDTCDVGLKQLAQNGLTIHRAIATCPWPGTANLEVAFVWGRSGRWHGEMICDEEVVTSITPQLTPSDEGGGDAFRLARNLDYGFEGVKILGIGFVITRDEAARLVDLDRGNSEVVRPYLIGMDLNSRWDMTPSRCVINFRDWPLSRETAPTGYSGPVAKDFPACLEIVERLVKPERLKHEPTNAWRSTVRSRWWQFAANRPKLYEAIQGRSRVFVRSRVSNLNSIACVPADWVFSDLVVVFSLEGFGGFGILQSSLHTVWLEQRSSSMRTDVRYTPSTCLHTFPFPTTTMNVAHIGEQYEILRTHFMASSKLGLTETYNRFQDPNDAAKELHKLRELHVEMDKAVAAAYGWTDLALDHGFHQTKQGTRFTISESARREVLARLLKLNHERFAEEIAAGLHDKKQPSQRIRKSSIVQPDELGLFGSGQ